MGKINKAILGISIFLIIVGLIGITGEIMTVSELTKTGGSPGEFPIPNFLIVLIIYQALLPLAMICAGIALILLEKKRTPSKK